MPFRSAPSICRELEPDFAPMNRVSMMGKLAASLSPEIHLAISPVSDELVVLQRCRGRRPTNDAPKTTHRKHSVRMKIRQIQKVPDFIS
jgi:hypothetical protein